ATIANRHASTYLELQRESKRSSLAEAMDWLDREVDELASRVREAEAAVQAYREENKLFASSTPVVQQQLAEISAQLALARAGLVEREARLRQAREAVDGSVAAEILQSDTITGLRQQELEASRRLADARGDMGERHPTIIKLRSELADVRQMIDREEEKIVQSLVGEAEIARQREADLARSVARFESELAESERAGAELRDLERQADAVRSLYESLLGQQEEVATQIGIPQADAKLVSPATAPRSPSYPRRDLLFAIALIAAGVSGGGLALALDRRRSGFESIGEVEAATGLRRVVAVPGVRQPFKRASMALPHRVAVEPRSAAAEAVRTLRATLAMQGNRITNLLAVTSSLPGEGKTSVALSLGRSLALSGASVLLIEADLRRHRLARYSRGIHARPGIVRVLEDDLPIEDAVVKDRATSLDLLPAEGGARSPQDLLGPDRFGRLIREAAAIYDYVIVDTPPIGAVSDALLIGRLVSAMLLVVRAGSTTRATVQGTIRTMADLGLPLAGIVLNAASPRRSSAYRY
ncbi:MAG: polysaccharide biosynthesis tyrosine autokinase, partial [Geminicoccaceae bacterium]|nr:polysaccharide biosynthesis tyrosine autokinase [Geminicoccaceae bacterium]